MTIDMIRTFALSLQDVEECMPFGPDNLVFKTNQKMFLLLSLDDVPVQFNVKCDPAKAIELRERYDAVRPGYHMNKQHWNTIVVTGEIGSDLLKEWIADSYRLVAQKL